MLYMTRGLQGQEPLTKTVRRLLKEVPDEAHSHSVFVYLPTNLYEVKAKLYVDGQVFPVVFSPATQDNPIGTVAVGYGIGNLESFIEEGPNLPLP